MAIGGYASDPYFMAAYSSPNTQYYQMLQQMQAAQAQSTAAATDTTAAANPAFQGTATAAEALPQEEKSSNAGWWILGAAATIAAGAYCYKKGDGKGLNKIVDGFKKIFSRTKDKAVEVVKGNKTEVKEFTINDKNLCTVPNRTNYIRKGAVTDELAKLGVSTDAPALTRVVDGKNVLDKGIKLRDYTFTHGGVTFRVRNGKLVTNGLASKYTAPVEQADIDFMKKVKEMITKFNSGENLNRVSNIKYSHSADGVSRLFTLDRVGGTAELQGAASNKFHINSDAVTAYRARNEEIDKALKALEKGEKDGLKIAQAEYVSPSLGTFKIQNGEISGITIDGQFYSKSSEKFEALQHKNTDAFNNVLKHKDDFTNIVYSAA